MSKPARLLVSVLAALGTLVLPVATQPAGAAGWTAPRFLRTIAGPGEAGVYAWGMEYNPVTNEMLVGDYWNYQIRRYDMSGHEIGAFYRPPSQYKGQPYTIEVDDRDGSIYVPELGNTDLYKGYIAHYDKVGNSLGEIHVPVGYWVWTHVDGRWLYVSAAHYSRSPKVYKFDLDNVDPVTHEPALVTSWGTFGTAPGQFGVELHGLDTDAAGNVYVADADRRLIHVFTPNGVWLRDFGGKGNALGQFTGDLRGISIDQQHGWVYVVDAEASQIEKFSLTGTPLAHWGSVGSGPGQYADGGREAAVDGNGHLWVADYGNFRFFEYGSGGALLHTYPDPAQGPVDGRFAEVRDVAVDPATGNVWGVDAWNNRFQEFSPNGAFLAKFGYRASHPPYGLDYPRGVAVDPATGYLWVANTREHEIRVYQQDGTYLFTVGSGTDSSAPGSFRLPMDIEFAGGKAYVSDYGLLYNGDPNSCMFKILDASTGTELQTITVCHNGAAVDPATGNIYTVSWQTDVVKVFSPAGELLNTFGSTGSGTGQFTYAWDADIVNGVLYVTDSKLKRVQAFGLDGSFLGTWGSLGQRPYQFDGPSGIAHDAAGNLYVADADNDRISVFAPSLAPVAGDITKPTVSLGTPAQDAQLAAASPAWIKGSVADTQALGTVEVAVQDRDSLQWWNAGLAKWQSAKIWNLAGVVAAGTKTGNWAFGLVGIERGERFTATARAIDSAGNISTVTAGRRFTIAP
jgi:DNA-binding beta-propeller fold protein YncE